LGVRKDQRGKRRKEILEAAVDLFIHRGYASTKITDIAERVGMSTGLMFHYFRSKEKLYEELIRLGINGPMNTIAPNGKEPLAFFEDIARQIFYLIKTDSFTSGMFVLMTQAFYNDAAPQGVKDMLGNFDIYKPTATMIQKGQEDGTIREGDPFALAIAFWCSINGIAEQIAINPNYPCPESDWIIDMLRRKK
jgi:AcrR family transcriptional regulator